MPKKWKYFSNHSTFMPNNDSILILAESELTELGLSKGW
jgi:hypothetical protein